MFTKKNNVLTFNSNSKFKAFIFYKNYFLNHSNLLKENSLYIESCYFMVIIILTYKFYNIVLKNQ
jgi:hypothetical protein